MLECCRALWASLGRFFKTGFLKRDLCKSLSISISVPSFTTEFDRKNKCHKNKKNEGLFESFFKTGFLNRDLFTREIIHIHRNETNIYGNKP